MGEMSAWTFLSTTSTLFQLAIETFLVTLILFSGSILIFPDLVEGSNSTENGIEYKNGPGAGILDASRRWPKGVVFYNFHSSFDKKNHDLMQSAMNHITGRTCITFSKKIEKDKNYVTIKGDGDTCTSNIGMIGGSQELLLGSPCHLLANYVHELCHVIGFEHEHQRNDRDKFVKIWDENIKSGEKKHFEKLNQAEYGGSSTPYDYHSILHYHSEAFAKDGKQSMTSLQSNVTSFGNKGLSRYDIMKINDMYCKGLINLAFQLQNPKKKVYLWNMGAALRSGGDLISLRLENNNIMKWTVGWDGFVSNGSKIWSWEQSGQSLQVLTENVTSHSVNIEEEDLKEGERQLWFVYPDKLGMHIVNLKSRRCLGLDGSQGVTFECKNEEHDQVWKVKKVFP